LLQGKLEQHGFTTTWLARRWHGISPTNLWSDCPSETHPATKSLSIA
jgi:hypothetical protein